MTLQIPRHYVATSISVIHSASPISISSLSLSLSLLHTVTESMALRLPTQLATPGKFHHHHHHHHSKINLVLMAISVKRNNLCPKETIWSVYSFNGSSTFKFCSFIIHVSILKYIFPQQFISITHNKNI